MNAIDGKPQAQADGDPSEAGDLDEKGEPSGAPTRETGTGALCPEAQADGVPCMEVGRDCEICEKAERER